MLFKILKYLFSRSGLRNMLDDAGDDKLQDWLIKAIKEENYELAAFIKHYVAIKKEKENKQSDVAAAHIK